MRVDRDAWGVPHLSAGSLLELARLQGRTAAQDRGRQIELDRLHAEGRTAEVQGPTGIVWDVFARRARVDEIARKSHERLTDETRAFVDAFVEGVREGLDPTDAAPGEWQPWTPLGVFAVHHVLFGSFPNKIWREHVAHHLGDEAVDVFAGEVEVWSGSNAWAAGGGRTASGLPMIGGDPHRVLESPGVYQQVRLAAPGVDVFGFAFPGVPGVQHFAHAGEVAWAITNAMADTQDLFVEQLRRVDRDGVAGVEARGAEGWYAADVHHESIEVLDAEPVEVEVVVTRRGPVVVGGPDDDVAWSLRTPPYVGRDLGFEAIPALLRARTVDDVDAALDHWVEPVNNVVIADRSGAVRYRVAGRVPRRDPAARVRPVPAWDDTHLWFGWVDDLPRHDVAADEVVVTANERRGPESRPIGHEFAARSRADRLRELLDAGGDLDVASAAALHVDTLAPQAALLADRLADVEGLSPAAELLRAELLAWDRRMDADSRGAAVHAVVRGHLVELVAEDPAVAALAAPTTGLFSPWLDLRTRVGLALDRWLTDAALVPLVDVVALVPRAVERAAAAGVPGRWGDTHRWLPDDAPATAVSGDSDCVLSTSSVPGVTDLVLRGPAARYVWDLSAPGAGGWVVPLGAAGDPASPHHHDQLPLWAGGLIVPLDGPTTEDA